MKKNHQIGQQIENFRRNHYRNQKALADALGVGQTVVSAWERGDNLPSSEAWVKLARLAPSPDKLWFLEQAGLDREIIVAAAKAQREEILIRPEKGEMILVPRVRKLPQGLKPAGTAVPMPAEAIPNALSTYCLVLGEHEFVLDTADAGAGDLIPFLGQSALLEFDPESGHRRPFGWPIRGGFHMGILYVGSEEYTLEGTLWQVMFLPQNAPACLPIAVGSWLDTRIRLDPRPREISDPTSAQDVEKFLIPASDTEALRVNREKVLQWVDSPERKARWAGVEEAIARAVQEATRNVRLAPGCKVLGRVIAQFPSKAEKGK